MYLPLTISFLLLLGIVIAAVQNTSPLELKLITWKLQMSLMTLIFYSSLFGGAIVAVLALPKLASKHLRVRRLKKQIHELKKKIGDLEKENAEVS